MRHIKWADEKDPLLSSQGSSTQKRHKLIWKEFSGFSLLWQGEDIAPVDTNLCEWKQRMSAKMVDDSIL